MPFGRGGGIAGGFDEGPGAVGFGKSSGNLDEDTIKTLQECGMAEQRAKELVQQYGWQEALKRAKFEQFGSS